jgi:hypothetical protein
MKVQTELDGWRSCRTGGPITTEGPVAPEVPSPPKVPSHWRSHLHWRSCCGKGLRWAVHMSADDWLDTKIFVNPKGP